MLPVVVKPVNCGVAPVCISCGVERVGLPDTPSPLVTVIWLVVPVIVLFAKAPASPVSPLAPVTILAVTVVLSFTLVVMVAPSTMFAVIIA
jgi:hypothetical protein